jgi:hypothetical protein
MTYDPRLLLIKSDMGITIRFPATGESRNKYLEENRQSVIAYENRKHANGWLPAGPEGWWRFKTEGSSEPVPPVPNVTIRWDMT